MGHDRDMKQMSVLAGKAVEAAEAAVQGGAAALSLLRAEMTALRAMMPGMTDPFSPPPSAQQAEEAARQEDAEVEAGFDNMPV